MVSLREELRQHASRNGGDESSQVKEIMNTDIPMRYPKIALATIAGLTVAWGSWFYVPNGHEATVNRFGRYIETAKPGLRGKMPLIDSVRKVNVSEPLRMEIGYRSSEKKGGQYTVVPEEAQMLTGDENIVNIDFTLQTLIIDPVAHQYSLADPESTLRDAAQATTRLVIGNNGIDKGLTDGKQEIQQQIQQNLQAIVNQYNMGRKITVQLQDVDPPREVEASFREVQTAKEGRETKVQQARAYESERIPKARGEAGQMVEQAKGYAANVIGHAEGDRDRFDAILAEYRKAPDITRKRIYLEAMQKTYPDLDVTIIEGKGTVPLYHLNDMKKEK